MQQDKKIIYVPIEIKTREYHAKTLFMLYAIKAGYQVVIGSSVQINRCIEMLPKGIYIGTSIAKAHNKLFDRIKKAGHKVVAFDEEGLIYYNKHNFVKNRINIETINNIERFFTWGQNHSDLAYKKDSALENCVQVGNMRFELLKSKYHGLYDEQVAKIKKKYGDFILINTNLGMYNHLNGKDYYYEVMRTMVSSYNAEDESFYKGKYLHQEEIFHSYKELVSYLSASKLGLNIVVRPHPSEKLSSWLDTKNDNVFVVNGGNIIPWILASKLVIQKNCTTSVESVYLNKPAITYSVNHDKRFDNEITNGLGLVCKTKEEVYYAINNISNIEQKLIRDKQQLKYYVENMNEDQNADTAIIKELDQIDMPEYLTKRNNIHLGRLRRVLLIWDIRSFLSGIIKRSNSWKNDRQKFKKLPSKEFIANIKKLSHGVNINSDQVKTYKIYDKLYHVELISIDKSDRK